MFVIVGAGVIGDDGGADDHAGLDGATPLVAAGDAAGAALGDAGFEEPILAPPMLPEPAFKAWITALTGSTPPPAS